MADLKVPIFQPLAAVSNAGPGTLSKMAFRQLAQGLRAL